MHVFFEEEGRFHAGSVLLDQGTSLQIEVFPSQKRTKVKAAQVLLRFEQPSPLELMRLAEAEAAQLEIHFLWETCGPEEFSFTDLAAAYYGHNPSTIEAAAIVMVLHAVPMYFYRRGRGWYQAAPPQALQAALAGLARKQQEAAQVESWVTELCAGKLPSALAAETAKLLYAPDKNSLTYRALSRAAETLQKTPLHVLLECGAVKSSHDFHLNRFLWQYFPRGAHHPNCAVETFGQERLPQASVVAFSIDDRTTTEIDDAFSVTTLPDGHVRIGIHIAAPALAVLPQSDLDQIAAERLSTVYFPGNKITMLPDSLVKQFSLDAGQWRPALSMYVTTSPTGEIQGTTTVLEQIQVAANLRHGAIEETFVDTTPLESAQPYQKELAILWQIAQKLEAGRLAVTGRPEPVRVDYNFYVENTEQGERIDIEARPRGSPLDKLVAEWMIFVNTRWGGLLAEAEVSGLYRTQQDNKVRMTTKPEAHEGLGVPQYLWSSSPLRRYVDLVNQRQILAVIDQKTPPYAWQDSELYRIMNIFETTYAAYHEFQHQMEYYWCLRWLKQEQIEEANATVVRENIVRFDRLPITMRVADLPRLERGMPVRLQIGAIDFFEPRLAVRYLGPLPSETPA